MFERLKKSVGSLIDAISKTELKGEKLDSLLWDFKLTLLENDVALPVVDQICEDAKKKLQGITVDHSTVLRWVKKYVRLMNNYVEQIKPNVSDTWRADELYIKVRGDLKYLFAMMDDETRFWIAQEVAETKDKHDARTLFFRAKRLMGKTPKTLITDGLPAYSIACEQVFDGTKHVRKITFDGKVHNNNKMERMNGEVRDREKTMRGLKRKRTPVLTGYQLYHNFLRPHESLNGKTPSEACGIEIQGKNKWITLIQNASKKAQIS